MSLPFQQRTEVFPTHVGVNPTRLAFTSLVGVFPTHVGVNRGVWAHETSAARIPHARGGEPVEKEDEAEVLEYSPRTWG